VLSLKALKPDPEASQHIDLYGLRIRTGRRMVHIGSFDVLGKVVCCVDRGVMKLAIGLPALTSLSHASNKLQTCGLSGYRTAATNLTNLL